MSTIEVLLNGFNPVSSEGGWGYCSINLVRGERTYLVDVGQPARRSNLLQALAAAGLNPNDIDAVFLTHSHWDHILNIDSFPNAEVILHRLELEYIHHPLPGDFLTPRYTRKLLEDQRVRTVEDGERLEPGLSVLLTPGHSRGSMTLLVDTSEGVAGIAGDALPTARAYHVGLPHIVVWSEQEARESIQRIAAATGLVYPGHDRPFRITPEGTVYLGPMRITVGMLVEPLQDNLVMTVNTANEGSPVTLGTMPPPAPNVFPREG